MNRSIVINIATQEGYEVSEKNTPEGKRLFLGVEATENNEIKSFAKGIFVEIETNKAIVYYSQSGKTKKLSVKQLEQVLKKYKQNGVSIFKDYEDTK